VHIILRGLAAAAALSLASSASAGPYADELGKCLIQKTTDADKALLIRGLFSALSAHPAVKEMVSQDAEHRRALYRETAQLYERLMVSDCRAETVAALKHEGVESLDPAFSMLGEASARQLMTDPLVVREMQALFAGMDMSKLEALGREADSAPEAKPAPHP
jgi:hypothetical protein